MCQVLTYCVNNSTKTDQYCILQSVLDCLLNVGLQELLFVDDDPQFRRVGGLYYEKSNYHHRQYLLVFNLYKLQSWTKIIAHIKYKAIDSVLPHVLKILNPTPSPHTMLFMVWTIAKSLPQHCMGGRGV